LRLLLDTHVLLWVVQGAISSQGWERVARDAEEVFASAASIWEIEIKRAQGRLNVPSNFVELVKQTGFEAMSIHYGHAVEAGRLPLHHRDPFDRMLVAQARIEGLTLATADHVMADYDVQLMAVSREAG
jgi:PIN domain nuclease of toxin-antitoxin system